MTRLGRFTAVALLVASCSNATTANGTALFVSVAWQDGWPIVQLQFRGTVGSTDAFAPADRPDPVIGALSTPQSVRILLKDTLGGQRIDLVVFGLVADGGTYASGSSSVDAVEGSEVSTTVELTQGGAGGGNAGGGTGGGATRPDAGAGGGSANGGGAGGGAQMSACNCATGCCVQGESICARVHGSFFTCPPDAGSICSTPVCDLLTANQCGAAGCRCGDRAACDVGTRCTVNASTGTGTCLCDEKSNCNGCCQNGICRAGNTQATCGTAGASCDSCTVGCALGVCTPATTVCQGDKCLSGKSCVDLAFPVCASAVNTCVGCDPLRSNACGAGGCACGMSNACGVAQTCVPRDGGSVCIAIVN